MEFRFRFEQFEAEPLRFEEFDTRDMMPFRLLACLLFWTTSFGFLAPEQRKQRTKR